MERVAAATSPIEVVEEPGSELAYERLTLRSPRDGQLLISDLSARSRTARACSSRVRTSRRRWRCSARPPASGTPARVASSGRRPTRSCSCPSGPYLPPGTLREALLRTGREYELPDEDDPRGAALARARAGARSRRRARRRARLGRSALARRAAGARGRARRCSRSPRFAVLHRIDTTLGSRAGGARARAARRGPHHGRRPRRGQRAARTLRRACSSSAPTAPGATRRSGGNARRTDRAAGAATGLRSS